jgi:soluble lytic murein transglycosylase-like protein
MIGEAARDFQVPERLLASVIANESAFNAHATSKAGAQGLGQIMPETGKGLGVSDAFDPRQNVAGTASYLAQLLRRFKGDAKLAVAAYNAGPGAVEKYRGVPPFAETVKYVEGVMGLYGSGGR